MFNPKDKDREQQLRVGVLFSGGASGGNYLVKNKSNKYRIIVGVTDNQKAKGVEKLSKLGVEIEVLDKKEFYSGGKTTEARRKYFSRLLEKLNKYKLDILVLSGFMQIVTDPLLDEYYPRIINVHPADLTIEEEDSRKYVGDDAVFDAVNSGEDFLRSTVHVVNECIDQGPVLILSRKFPVEQELVKTLKRRNPQMVRSYSDIIQEWMKWEGDGPSLAAALNLIGKGDIVSKGNNILIKRKGSYVKGYLDLEKKKIVPAG